MCCATATRSSSASFAMPATNRLKCTAIAILAIITLVIGSVASADDRTGCTVLVRQKATQAPVASFMDGTVSVALTPVRFVREAQPLRTVFRSKPIRRTIQRARGRRAARVARRAKFLECRS